MRLLFALMRISVAAFIGVLAWQSSAHADNLAVYGPGNMPCTGWLYGREQASPSPDVFQLTFAAEMWVLGYLSAANVYELRLAPAEAAAGKSLYLWIDNYCRAHPDNRINEAIRVMIATTRSKH